MSDGKQGRYDVGGNDDELGGSETADVAETTPTGSARSSDASKSTRESEGDTPHRVRYDSPKDARSPKQFVLEDDDLEQISKLERIADREFDEKVYEMDVTLAALRAGLSANDSAFLEEMKTIGYGYFDYE